MLQRFVTFVWIKIAKSGENLFRGLRKKTTTRANNA